MNHPYKEFEDSKYWEIIEKAINDLSENRDITITTRKEYIVGFICKAIHDLELETD